MRFHPLRKSVIKLIILLLISLSTIYFRQYQSHLSHELTPKTTEKSSEFTNPATIKQAFENQQSNLQVKQSGRIIKILRDDKYGAKHQRFLVQINSGHKLLIAHNIELSPRIDDLKEGETIIFYGEYELNNKGGVIHWTHRDPRGHHPDGWLIYNNRKYQ